MTINCAPPVGATPQQHGIWADAWHPTEVHEPRAKRLCNGCPARTSCLQAALTPDPISGYPSGIFGGTTTAERARMRRQARDQKRVEEVA